MQSGKVDVSVPEGFEDTVSTTEGELADQRQLTALKIRSNAATTASVLALGAPSGRLALTSGNTTADALLVFLSALGGP